MTESQEAMALAADYREQGLSPSRALKEAWRDVKSGEGTSFQPSLLTLAALGLASWIGW